MSESSFVRVSPMFHTPFRSPVFVLVQCYLNFVRPYAAMNILLTTPAAPGSRHGNRATAERWTAFFRRMGHSVSVEEEWTDGDADMMVALHARRSHPSIRRFAAAHPNRPLIVAFTGTDLYRDIHTDGDAQKSLELATRLVVLQEAGILELDPRLQRKTSVVRQSAESFRREEPDADAFEVCVVGHLRDEKDPFRAAVAADLLPTESRIRVVHLGGAREELFASKARSHMADNPRYRWLGEVSHERVREILARTRLLVQSSFMEGGANAVSEALAGGVPVIASHIPGNVGMLGEDYPAYFPAGDERHLARLLQRAESDPAFYALLEEKCAARRELFSPEREYAALERLLDDAIR
ncbi:MAG: selenoneine biosynthesis selenosugar synthase SenB [Rubrobacteraceae bacterium]